MTNETNEGAPEYALVANGKLIAAICELGLTKDEVVLRVLGNIDAEATNEAITALFALSTGELEALTVEQSVNLQELQASLESLATLENLVE